MKTRWLSFKRMSHEYPSGCGGWTDWVLRIGQWKFEALHYWSNHEYWRKKREGQR